MKRVKVSSKCPNPLFISWLENWKEDAKSRGSEMQHCFGKALNTLKKYPLALKSGRECIILENFGPKLCAMLDRKLEEYKSANIDDPTLRFEYDEPEVERAINNNNNDNNKGKKKSAGGKRQKSSEATEQPAKKIKTPTNRPGSYIPAWRSGGYAILLTLYEKSQDPNFIGFMTKADLQADAQKHCDHSLRKPEPGSRYSAWSSMSILIQKGLVTKDSNPAKYRLTDAGLAVALQLSEVDENDSIFKCSSRSNTSAQSSQTSGFSKEKSNGSQNSALLKELRAFPFEEDVFIIHSSGSSTQDKNEDLEFNWRRNIEENIRGENNDEEILRFRNNNNEKQASKGKQIFSRVERTEDEFQNLDINKKTDSQRSSSSGNEINIVFRPRTFDIILLIDDRETAGGKTRPKDDATIVELTQARVRFEVRNLKIGDFTWIARSKESGEEVVLPYIVERKRMDDFGGSIKDGRYHEQKFRLKRSGIQNITYLIENHGNNQFTGLPMTTLSQAAINTLVQDGFNIKYTKSHRESMFYLASFSDMLNNIYQGKTLVGCKKEDLTETNVLDDVIQVMLFKDCNKAATKVKIFTAREMFIRHLIQLKGLSVEKASAIVNSYPTPKALKKAFDAAGTSGENLLAGIQFGATKRQIGPALSKTVHQFYTRKDF